MPGFLPAMVVGVIISNASDLLGREHHKPTNAATAILIAVVLQALLITLVMIFFVFRLTGRNYDSAVMAAGFAGLGLGATPVAIANMNALTGRYGPSPKACLVIPLIGAFFVDIMNALVIKFFLALPIMQQGAS